MLWDPGWKGGDGVIGVRVKKNSSGYHQERFVLEQSISLWYGDVFSSPSSIELLTPNMWYEIPIYRKSKYLKRALFRALNTYCKSPTPLLFLYHKFKKYNKLNAKLTNKRGRNPAIGLVNAYSIVRESCDGDWCIKSDYNYLLFYNFDIFRINFWEKSQQFRWNL